MKKINVLGSDWKIVLKKLNGFDGLCDHSTKTIYLDNSRLGDIGNFESNQEKVLRHEIVHAFLYESGLHVNSDWAANEEMVDWIAIQLPKINQVLSKLKQ